MRFRVIGVYCCLCMGDAAKAALTPSATSRSQSSRRLPAGASSPKCVKIESASRKARNAGSIVLEGSECCGR